MAKRKTRGEQKPTGGRRRGYAKRSRLQPLLIRAGFLAGALALAIIAANSLGLFRPDAGVSMPDRGRGHVPNGQPVQYDSIPPTSGTHWVSSVAAWGAYTERVPDETIVHNLEHGGIAIAHNGIDEATIAKMRGFLTTFPKSRFGTVKLVIHLDNRLPSGQIAVTAWTRIDRLDRLDEARIRRFYEAHLERCCEQVP